MTTFGEIKDNVLSVLQAQTNTTYSDTLVYQAICGSIDAILPWVPKAALTDLVGDGLTTVFILPVDLYRIEAIQLATADTFLERVMFTPGNGRKSSWVDPELPRWSEYPKGSLRFSAAPASNTQLRVYYFAHYGKPASPVDLTYPLETPASALMGMVYWAAAHCLIPSAVAASQIRQFNLKIDSGAPTDNAVEMQARFLRALFADEMSRQPRYAGATQ